MIFLIMTLLSALLIGCSRVENESGPTAFTDTISLEADPNKCYAVRVYVDGIDLPEYYADVASFEDQLGTLLTGSTFEISRGDDVRTVSVTEANRSDLTYNYTGPAYVIVDNRLCGSGSIVKVDYSLSMSLREAYSPRVVIESEL